MPKSLRRTTYRDRLPPNNMRSGPATRAEVGLDLESYHQPLIEALASAHGPAIVSGLKLSATVGSPDVVVTPGVAVDGQGRLIVLAEGAHAEIGTNADAAGATPQLAQVAAAGVRLPTAGITGNKLLLIRWWETFDEAGFSDNGAQRVEHTPWLQFVDVQGFDDNGMRVMLSIVQFGTGADAGKIKGFFPFRKTLVKVDNGLEFRSLIDDPDVLKSQDGVVARIDGNGLSGGVTLSIPSGPDKKAELTLVPDGEMIGFAGNTPKLAMDFFSVVTNLFAFSSRDPGDGSVQFSPDDGTVQFFGKGASGSKPTMSIRPGVIHIDTGQEFVIEAPIPGGVRINANLTVDGRATFRGPKVGFVVDAFHNATGRRLELGDVVVLAKQAPDARLTGSIAIPSVEIATGAYDTRLCGVVSDAADPGADGHMVTLGCWAHCKVDADISPVSVGDLLTTSETAGHAQKVVDRSQAFGAVVGKALGALASGRGMIPVLVSFH